MEDIMPYIVTRTNAEITPEISEKLKTRLGEAITEIPGKSESWLMVENIGGCDLYFKGKNSSVIVFAEVKLYGGARGSDYHRLTAVLTEIYGELLGASPSKVYVKYEETPHWGWNGANF